MKKVLLATTMLAGTAGFAAAEITLSGSAVMGLDYTNNAAAGDDSTTTLMETYLTFSASGETDSGLSFGMSQTIATYSTDGGLNDDGTSVFISGAFGKLTMGSVAEADEVAGLSDIGLTGIGVDNVAEAVTGDSSGGLGHNVHYTYSVGDFTVSVSALIGKASAAVDAVPADPLADPIVVGSEAVPALKNDSFAIGAKYNFGDYYVGVGYNDTDIELTDTGRDGATTSVYVGGTAGAIGVKAMYSTWSPDEVGEADVSAWGVNVDYSMGATTLSLAVADNDLSTKTSYGVGLSYDLGGGASFVAGAGSVDDEKRAQLGVSMSF